MRKEDVEFELIEIVHNGDEHLYNTFDSFNAAFDEREDFYKRLAERQTWDHKLKGDMYIIIPVDPWPHCEECGRLLVKVGGILLCTNNDGYANSCFQAPTPNLREIIRNK